MDLNKTKSLKNHEDLGALEADYPQKGLSPHTNFSFH